MMDRDRSSEREDSGREGFGDDQGTRVGSPDPAPGAGRDAAQPGQVSEELRASSPEQPRADRGTGNTGMGAEGAEGVHGARTDEIGEPSVLENVDTGRTRPNEETVDRAGSEPLEGRTREHQSGYGGQGGRPKVSSDERQALDDR